jgi:hypothetical protein
MISMEKDYADCNQRMSGRISTDSKLAVFGEPLVPLVLKTSSRAHRLVRVVINHQDIHILPAKFPYNSRSTNPRIPLIGVVLSRK